MLTQPDNISTPLPQWDSIRSELQRMLAEEPQISSSREGIMLLAEQLFELWQATRKETDTLSIFQRGIRYEATILTALSLRFLIDLPTMKG